MNRVSLIFAIARNGVIGHGGGLPWDFPEDRAHFTRTTMGHAVLMGRRTWEETGRPLDGRTNIVVTRAILPGVVTAPTLDLALEAAWEIDAEPFVIGGVRLFEEALLQATRVYVTDVPGDYEGDTVLRFDRRPFRAVSSREGEHGLVFRVLEPDLRETSALDPAALALFREYFAELRARLPSFAPPTDEELRLEGETRTATLLAYEAERAVACVALRPLDPHTFEIKRMFVVPDARGRGYARRLLQALEVRAEALGATRIVLDTAAPLAEAARLYLRAGYTQIAPYNDNPYAARWFEKRFTRRRRA